MDFLKLTLEIASLSTIVFSGVSFLKKLGISGNWLTGSSFAFGLALGGAYRFFVYAPNTGLDWFILVTFGLLGGFLASGVYQGIADATGKK